MSRIDVHVKILNDRVVRRAKRAGLDGIVYAPHFVRLPEIERRAAAYSDDTFQVYPAREIFTGAWSNRRHVLGIGLTAPIPDFITLEAAIRSLRTQGAAILVPHPTFTTISLNEDEIRTYSSDIDAIETYNPKTLRRHDSAGRRLATELGVPEFASSYAHLPWIVGDVATRFDRDIEDLTEFTESLHEGIPREIERTNGLLHTSHRLIEIAHLGWENSWQKLDRVLISGREATYPGHPAYGGRFDEHAVY